MSEQSEEQEQARDTEESWEKAQGWSLYYTNAVGVLTNSITGQSMLAATAPDDILWMVETTRATVLETEAALRERAIRDLQDYLVWLDSAIALQMQAVALGTPRAMLDYYLAEQDRARAELRALGGSQPAPVVAQSTPSVALTAEGFQALFGLRTGEAGFDPAYDLNRDGVIDVTDYSIWVSAAPVAAALSISWS